MPDSKSDVSEASPASGDTSDIPLMLNPSVSSEVSAASGDTSSIALAYR